MLSYRRRALLSIFALPLWACAQVTKDDTLVLKGSDTMKALVLRWSEGFEAQNPTVDVVFSGGGSGMGVHALLHGLVDIAASSRPLMERERRGARRRDFRIAAFPVARDGVGIVVHPENPVTELALEDLRAIFSGRAKSWLKIGGRALPIRVLVRGPRSGTQLILRERLLGGRPFSADAVPLPSNVAILDAVQNEPSAVGFVSMAHAHRAQEKAHTIALKAPSLTSPLHPTTEALRSGQYPLARDLFLFVVAPPADAAKRFLAFVRGPEGQAAILEEGFVPYAEPEAPRNAPL